MDLWQFTTSPEFKRILHGLTTLSLIMAIGISITAMAYYGRAREKAAADTGDQKWTMLFATWRDSLIITVLFVAQSFAFRFGDFSSHLSVFSGSIFLLAPAVMPALLLISDILIFTVAFVRIVA
ncbi:MAG: hypothetical protein VX181_02890, partial [Pseudomonadota bacterium]|nr:hypothetical protein [Pseudomonadota bacterium]